VKNNSEKIAWKFAQSKKVPTFAPAKQETHHRRAFKKVHRKTFGGIENLHYLCTPFAQETAGEVFLKEFFELLV